MSRRALDGPAGPLRVAQICGAVDGARWMVDISIGLRARGYEVVAIIASGDGDTAANLKSAGVPFVVMPHALQSTSRALWLIRRAPLVGKPLYYLLDGLALLRTAARMARVLRRLRIDISHTHVYQSIMVGRIAAFMARTPMRVAMIPGPYHLEVEQLRRSDIATHRLDHRLLAGSRYTDDLYGEIGVSPKRRRLVPYGVDPATFDPDHADPQRIRRELGVGASTPLIGQVAIFYGVFDGPTTPPWMQGRSVKGHEDLVAAAQLVLEKRSDARFLFVGGGWGPLGEEQLRNLQQRCRELGIADSVIFTGHRTDVPDILAALDVSVQCSLSENYGGTIESLLMCAPTVATRVGGMPEAVRHDETGLLVPPRDPPALASAILRLLEDRALADRLGRRGRHLMLRGFTIQRTIEGVADVYRELEREQSPASNGRARSS